MSLTQIKQSNISSDFNPSYRNLIINGAMQIAQRATSATGVSNSTYPALDRWKYFLSGPTVNVSQESFSLGQTDVSGEPEFYLKNTISSNSGASDYAIVAQHIEDVRTFAGQTCTLSFWAKSSVSGNKIAIELNQSFGSGGSASARVVTGDSDVVTLSTSWQKFSVTLTVPSISGKTIDPSTNTSYLELYLWLTGGSTWDSRASSIGNQSGDFDIALVQFEAGESATEFEHRPYGLELALCQRYYYVPLNYRWLYALTSGNTGNRRGNADFPVTMRSQPTVTPTWGQYASGTLGLQFGSAQGVTFYSDGVPDTSYTTVIFTAEAEL